MVMIEPIVALNQRTDSALDDPIEYEYRDAEYECEEMPERVERSKFSTASTFHVAPIRSQLVITNVYQDRTK
jgi:hypothetical protein